MTRARTEVQKEAKRSWQQEYDRRHYEENFERRKIQLRAWREANPITVKRLQHKSSLKRRYGDAFTQHDYALLLESQNHACAICERPFGEKRAAPNVDHCHTTGKVRGLLCFDCNTALGKLGDTVESLRRATQYLEDNS